MIYCPKCKTANRDGSRFCNECGEKLGTETSSKCPECGALNPIQNIFCSECGARLFSPPAPSDSEPNAPALKGLSLPTKSPPGAGEIASDEIAPDLSEGSEAPQDSTLLAVERSGAAPQEENLPDWLRDLRASLPEEAIQLEDDEASDDLAELRASAPEREPEPEAEFEPEADAGQAPDWLAELQAAATGEPLEGPFEPDEEEVGDAPAWLAQLRSAGLESAPAGAEPEAAEEGMADWLATSPPEDQQPEPEAKEEMPDWLAQLRATEPESAPADSEPEAAEAETPASEPEPFELEEIPDWLREFQAREEADDLVGAGEGAIPADGGAPGRRADLDKSCPEEPSPMASEEGETGEVWGQPDGLPPEEGGEQASVADQSTPLTQSSAPPDWLTAITSPAEEEAILEETLADAELPDWLVPRPVDEGETLEKAAIPEWLLALKPKTSERGEQEAGPIQAAEEAVEETGLLAGVKGALPAEMLIAAPRAAKIRGSAGDEIEDTPQSRLFAQVVSQPPAVAPKVLSRRGPAAPSQLGRWLIAFFLIAAVALPLLLNQPLLPRTVQPAPAVEALHSRIDALKPGEAVLLSFDYDPTTRGEMDVVARPLIEHLVERQVRLAAVSLLPAGPATAQSLLEELAAEGQYANLGYIPGQVAAVRLLARSWDAAVSSDWQGVAASDLEALEGVSNLADFALVLELAASQDTLRWWIEQAAEPYELRLGAGVSAAIDPVARSYYETNSHQLAGVVGGVMGAAAYDGLANGQGASSSTFAAWLDAQTAGTLVLILVLVLGNIAYLFRRPKGEEHG